MNCKDILAPTLATFLAVGGFVECLRAEKIEKPHGEFLAVSSGMAQANIAMGNTSPMFTAVTVSNGLPISDYSPAEWKMPHDHLVIDFSSLLLGSTKKV